MSAETSASPRIGIIGGSGLYAMEGLRIHHERRIETPFGEPSDAFVIGELDGVPIAFLARHGRGHRIVPSEINFRANLFGFKLLGVEMILSASAVGSMKEQYHPTDIVFPLQFIDRTRHRPDTFFGNGVVAHVAFADPICGETASIAFEAARDVGASAHLGGTYLCMEGPQFSTRAESHLYRSWGVDVIGMTNLQEAKLAREAEICYATIALVTDYDCWHQSEAAVSVEQVIAYLNQNAETACRIFRRAVASLAARKRGCPCASALRHAILTEPSRIPDRVRDDLGPLIGKYV
ncbi:MAG TPA: S-methyl-5'-thioadenosine phosphorylase [Thermoanaerobaculia bacterium]|nr:S-methyl-5'-thioadenosine phosphorylase [Thermoanaerobaculia bacterium]